MREPSHFNGGKHTHELVVEGNRGKIKSSNVFFPSTNRKCTVCGGGGNRAVCLSSTYFAIHGNGCKRDRVLEALINEVHSVKLSNLDWYWACSGVTEFLTSHETREGTLFEGKLCNKLVGIKCRLTASIRAIYWRCPIAYCSFWVCTGHGLPVHAQVVGLQCELFFQDYFDRRKSIAQEV